MKLPKIRELGEAIKALVSGPYTSRFPFEPATVPEGFRGKPQFYQDDCVGCLACYEVCPARAIDYADDKTNKERVLTHHQDICIFCQQCEKACITEKGIRLTSEFDLATYDRRQAVTQSKKELVLCDSCGEVISALDHLKFLSEKVGHLAYANPGLILARHLDLGLVEIGQTSKSGNKRAGHLTLLCPHCRREMILKEQW